MTNFTLYLFATLLLYPLTAPPAMPLMKCFCSSRKTVIIGKMDRMTAAKTRLSLLLYWPTKVKIDSCKVRISFLGRNNRQ